MMVEKDAIRSLMFFFCRETTILISRDILIVTECFDHNGTFVTL